MNRCGVDHEREEESIRRKYRSIPRYYGSTEPTPADRFHLAIDVIVRLARAELIGGHVLQAMRDRLIAHKRYIVKHGDDMPEIRD
ncbi:MAG TPA: hypothetical protein VIV66_04235 [Pyrinomonadaceae bacterium]